MKHLSPKVRILIVEDEMVLAQDVSLRLVDSVYDVVGIVDSADKALQILKEVPDVHIILMDIMIKGDLDGIDLAKLINKNYNIPFIFLTSHSDTSIVERAKQVNPYAYLLKPFNDRQISIAIELALTNFSKRIPEKKLLKEHEFSKIDNNILKIKNNLFLKKNNRYERVSLDEIQFLEADNNYTIIHTKFDKFLYSTVLKKIEAQLPNDLFLRVHRSYMVNINAIAGFEGNMLFINDKKIPVSKSNHNQVFNLFETL